MPKKRAGSSQKVEGEVTRVSQDVQVGGLDSRDLTADKDANLFLAFALLPLPASQHTACSRGSQWDGEQQTIACTSGLNGIK